MQALTTSDWIAVASVVIAVVALGVAVYAIGRSNKNSSAATLVTLNEGFRQAWQRFLSATEEGARHHEFCELMNLFEVSCAIHLEKSLVGVSAELMAEYLRDTLRLLDSNDEVVERLGRIVHSPTTFHHLRHFIDRMPKCDRPGRVGPAIRFR